MSSRSTADAVRLFFDTNILLDGLLLREPFAADAASLFAIVASSAHVGMLSATTATDIFYIARKQVGSESARALLRDLLHLFEVAPVDVLVLLSALDLPGFADVEDAVQHEAARVAGADAIVTRNTSDFSGSLLPVFTPAAMRVRLAAEGRV